MFPEANRAGLIGDAFNLARCVVLGKLYMYDAPIDVLTAGVETFDSHARDWGSIPGRDRPMLLKQVVRSPLPNARQQVWASRVLGDGHHKGCWPVTQWVLHVKESSLFKGHECRVWVKLCNSSRVMVTSSYEWKILEYDEIPKQTNTEYFDCSILGTHVLWSLLCRGFYDIGLRLFRFSFVRTLLITSIRVQRNIFLPCRNIS